MASVRSLTALGLDGDPLSRPLSYPGPIPAESGLLFDGNYLPLPPMRGLVHGRSPVLAVGSNAAPAQLTRKFARHDVPSVVPMVRVRVTGMAAGVSAHVSHGRYIPSAPVASPGEVSEMFVLWLDDAQVRALDATEPNYRRTPLGEQFPVRLPSGQRVRDCAVYVSRWGCLADSRGEPRRAGDQRQLLVELLAESVELRRLCGDTPEDFVEAARDATVRERAGRLLAGLG